MFEKPQYMTPNGFRRFDRDRGPVVRKARFPHAESNSKGTMKLSPEAAHLIAMAIRAMLHEK